jgi:hypothetical protein
MNTAEEYLTLRRSESGPAFWQWAKSCDAIETAEGQVLCLYEELHPLLEGVFSCELRPHFGFVLNLLDCARLHRTPFQTELTEVWHELKPHLASTKPTPRNLGRFFVTLATSLACPQSNPTWEELQIALERRKLFGERVDNDLPPSTISNAVFTKWILHRLRAMSPETIRSILQYGEAPVQDSEKIAAEIRHFPDRLGAFLEEVQSRERLVGAAFLIPTLESALILPPHRPKPDRLPQGGYADVTTRGDLDRLLPSQFALEGEEFIRRFSENELLYFRREEPHQPKKPERIVLLDQGIRTWGRVRLGLAGAAISLISRDPSRHGVTRLGLTTEPRLLDPWELSEKALADKLERSGMNREPSRLLEAVLSQTTGAPRDALLLTHPRNLLEPQYAEAVSHLAEDDRLFTVTLTEEGDVELIETTTAHTRTIRKFHINLDGAEAARIPNAKPKPISHANHWTGDVEPVPFPYRAGMVSDVNDVIGFDADGEYVVVLGRDDVLHLKKLNSDEPMEVLPRAYKDGKVIRGIHEVIPIKDGIVAMGLMEDQAYLAIYNFHQRLVTILQSRISVTYRQDFFFSSYHVLVMRSSGNDLKTATGEILDLLKCEIHEPNQSQLTRNMQQAWLESFTSDPTVCRPLVQVSEDKPWVENVDNSLRLHGSFGPWKSVKPKVEGRPVFMNATMHSTVLANHALAVKLTRQGDKAKVVVIQQPGSIIAHMENIHNLNYPMMLSMKGDKFARQTQNGRTVEVRALDGNRVERLTNGGYHANVIMALTDSSLMIRVGRYNHEFILDQPDFQHVFGRSGSFEAKPNIDTKPLTQTVLAYDPERFSPPVYSNLWMASRDRWGQVVLMNRAGEMVMTICICRGLAAAWLPSGVRWGHVSLLGVPPTPLAEMLIGQALQTARGGS